MYYCHESLCGFAKDYASKIEHSGVIDSLLNLPLVGANTCAEPDDATRSVRLSCPWTWRWKPM